MATVSQHVSGSLILESMPETSAPAPVPGRSAELVWGSMEHSSQAHAEEEVLLNCLQFLWLCLSIRHGLPSPWDSLWFLGLPLTPVRGHEGAACL